MSDYRRWYVPGGTYFFTVVTYARRPILGTENGRAFLKQAIQTAQDRRFFTLVAQVLLPDHSHLVMQLQPATTTSIGVEWLPIQSKVTMIGANHRA